jgi:S1-C subfamily serine protease
VTQEHEQVTSPADDDYEEDEVAEPERVGPRELPDPEGSESGMFGPPGWQSIPERNASTDPQSAGPFDSFDSQAVDGSGDELGVVRGVVPSGESAPVDTGMPTVAWSPPPPGGWVSPAAGYPVSPGGALPPPGGALPPPGGALPPPAGSALPPPPGRAWPGGPGYPPSGGAYVPYGSSPVGAGPWPGYPPPNWNGAPVATQRTSRSGLIGLMAGFGVVALLMGGAIGHATWPSTSGGGSGGGSSISIPAGGNSIGGGDSSSPSEASGAPSNSAAIAAKVTPGLVDINTNLSYEGASAAGTGMVLTSNGEILTNNHVIDGATSINVTVVSTQKSYTAHVVGYDKSADVAVVQLTGANGLSTINPNSANASVGQAVVALGNAGGAGGAPSVAGGSITALNQSITASENGSGANSEALSGLIETNANIQPGDSGGALSNAAGQVIGMNTAAAASGVVGGVTSQAYAIPIGTALGVAKSIESGTGGAGIHLGTTAFIGIQVQNSGSGGGVVAQVISGSPASAIGLQAGDTVTSVNGVTIKAPGDISAQLASKHAGDVVAITWVDASGGSHSASVTLASGPPA